MRRFNIYSFIFPSLFLKSTEIDTRNDRCLMDGVRNFCTKFILFCVRFSCTGPGRIGPSRAEPGGRIHSTCANEHCLSCFICSRHARISFALFLTVKFRFIFHFCFEFIIFWFSECWPRHCVCTRFFLVVVAAAAAAATFVVCLFCVHWKCREMDSNVFEAACTHTHQMRILWTKSKHWNKVRIRMIVTHCIQTPIAAD